MQSKIHFIAILPNESIQEEVTNFKLEAADLFNSRHALKSPPHITLIPPFKWYLEDLVYLENALSNFTKEESSFPIELKNFAFFPPRVVFVDVLGNQLLKTCQTKLHRFLKEKLGLVEDRPSRGFHPHMTVAFKDLKREDFPIAKAHFEKKSYERTFQAEEIALLQHNGKRWEVLKSFPLS